VEKGHPHSKIHEKKPPCFPKLLYTLYETLKNASDSLSTAAKMTKERIWNMTIKLNARLIALTFTLLLVALLLVGIVVLHVAHSVPWHIFALSPNIIIELH
jgi:hypothetical protein